MADTIELINSELDNIAVVVTELSKIRKIPEKISLTRISGIGGLLQNFYNGIENILKIILNNKKISLPQGPSWHRELILLSSSKGILSETLVKDLHDYLTFRHFVTHAYAVDLKPAKLLPLIKNINKIFKQFKSEILAYLGET